MNNLLRALTWGRGPNRVKTLPDVSEYAARPIQTDFAWRPAHGRRCSTDAGDRIANRTGHQQGLRFCSSAASGMLERSALGVLPAMQLPYTPSDGLRRQQSLRSVVILDDAA